MDNSRYTWVDTAKALGMFLVFYGHLVERVYNAGVPEAFYQFKFIYAFHMPLFFFMAGFFWRPSTRISDQIKKLVLRRLIPVFAFAALLLPLWPIHQWQWFGSVHWRNIMWQALDYFHGAPRLNWITWFLVCLFTCEFLAMLIFPKLRSRRLVFLFGVCTLFIGLVMCQNISAIVRIFGVAKNTWFIHESIVALGFYSMGYALFPQICSLAQRHSRTVYPLGMLALGALLLTYKINNPSEYFVVMLTSSSHGKMLPFVTSAVAGITLILSLSVIMPRLSIILFIGKNTLPLLGLNGVFVHFANARFVARLLPESTFFSVTIYCAAVTLFSLAVSAPIVAIMDRLVPQLVGRSHKDGPLLPNLEIINWKALTRECTGRIMARGRAIIRR